MTDRELLRETYAAHQIFMNLGYQADEIFVGTRRGEGETVTGEPASGRRCWIVQLVRGERKLTLLIAPLKKKQEKRFLRVWRDFAVKGKREASVTELDGLLYGSILFARKLELLARLAVKGFVIEPLLAYQ